MRMIVEKRDLVFLSHGTAIYTFCTFIKFVFNIYFINTQLPSFHSGILLAAEHSCAHNMRVFVRFTTQHFYICICICICMYAHNLLLLLARLLLYIFFFFIFLLNKTLALSETLLTSTAHFERLNWNEWKIHDERAKIKTKEVSSKLTQRTLNTLQEHLISALSISFSLTIYNFYNLNNCPK